MEICGGYDSIVSVGRISQRRWFDRVEYVVMVGLGKFASSVPSLPWSDADESAGPFGLAREM